MDCDFVVVKLPVFVLLVKRRRFDQLSVGSGVVDRAGHVDEPAGFQVVEERRQLLVDKVLDRQRATAKVENVPFSCPQIGDINLYLSISSMVAVLLVVENFELKLSIFFVSSNQQNLARVVNAVEYGSV